MTSSYVDNFAVALASAHTAGSGSFALVSGSGAILSARLAALGFPAISAGNPLRFTVIVQSARGVISSSTTYAVYLATGLTGDTLTGCTATEGTTDVAFAAGDVVAVLWTAGAVLELQTAIASALTSSSALDPTKLSSAVPITKGGTGATTSADALTALGAQPAGTYLTSTSSGASLTGITAAQVGAAQWLVPTAVKTSAYNAAANDLVPCDATSASFTVTLPSAPVDKTRVAVKLIATASSHTVTVACGGSDVFNKSGGTTSATLSLLNQSIALQYQSTGGLWYVVADDLPLSQLDSRYLTPTGSGASLTGITVSQVSGAAPAASPTFTGTVTLPTGLTGLVKTSSGVISTATAGIDYLTPTGDASNVSGRDLYELMRSRNYQAIVRVTSTIASALSAISDAAWNKRYLVVVPAGTYAEAVDLSAKPWIDLVGQSRTGTILTGTGVADTIKAGGNALIANMTVQCTPTSTPYYPIHIDYPNPTTILASTVTIWNVTAQALGANAKSGIGIGLRGGQTAILADSSFSTVGNMAGIYAHNTNASTAPCWVDVLNCAATSTGATTAYGLEWQNFGSGQPDRIVIRGGTFSATTKDIQVDNNTGGTGEAWINIDGGATYTTISLVDATKQITCPAIPPSTPAIQPGRPEYTGPITTSPAGMIIDSSGLGEFNTLQTLFYFQIQGVTSVTMTGSLFRPYADFSFWCSAAGTEKIYANGGHTRIAASGNVYVDATGYFRCNKLAIFDANMTVAGSVGFCGASATAKQTVTGSRGGNAALASLLTALAAFGLITDSSS